jgi:hypothetical protein
LTGCYQAEKRRLNVFTVQTLKEKQSTTHKQANTPHKNSYAYLPKGEGLTELKGLGKLLNYIFLMSK